MRKYRGRLQQFAGAIDDRDLHARAQSRVEAHGDARTGGRREQQVMKIVREHTDCLFFGKLA